MSKKQLIATAVIAAAALAPATAMANPSTQKCPNPAWSGFYENLQIKAPVKVFGVGRCQVAKAVAADFASTVDPRTRQVVENGQGGFDAGRWHVKYDATGDFATATHGSLRVTYMDATS